MDNATSRSGKRPKDPRSSGEVSAVAEAFAAAAAVHAEVERTQKGKTSPRKLPATKRSATARSRKASPPAKSPPAKRTRVATKQPRNASAAGNLPSPSQGIQSEKAGAKGKSPSPSKGKRRGILAEAIAAAAELPKPTEATANEHGTSAAKPTSDDPIISEALQAVAKRKRKLHSPPPQPEHPKEPKKCGDPNCNLERQIKADEIAELNQRIQELQESLQEREMQAVEADIARQDAEQKRDSALSQVEKLKEKLQKQEASLKDQKKQAKKQLKQNTLFNRNTKLMHLSDAEKLLPKNNEDGQQPDIYKHDIKWQTNYKHLKHFFEQYGHTNFSQHTPEHQRLHYPANLHHWVSTQRTMYRKLKAGEKNTLTPYRIQMLQQIQFNWQPQGHDQASFDTRIEQLEAYKLEHGDLRVPQKYVSKDKNTIGLGNWVLMMRRKYRQGKLPQERIDVLEAMGFEWTLRDRKNDMRVILQQQFHDRGGVIV